MAAVGEVVVGTHIDGKNVGKFVPLEFQLLKPLLDSLIILKEALHSKPGKLV